MTLAQQVKGAEWVSRRLFWQIKLFTRVAPSLGPGEVRQDCVQLLRRSVWTRKGLSGPEAPWRVGKILGKRAKVRPSSPVSGPLQGDLSPLDFPSCAFQALGLPKPSSTPFLGGPQGFTGEH